MANPGYYAHLSEWIFNEQHCSWHRFLTCPGHACKYVWPDTYRPAQPGLSPYEQPRLWAASVSTPGPVGNQLAPKQYSLELSDFTRPGPVRSSIPFEDIPVSSRVAYTKTDRYVLHPMRYFRLPSESYSAGYCDHHACNDPRCIENQYLKYSRYRKYGWRDDLRHHEDQDKNGNMRDGDKVGEHCPPTADDAEEDDDEDDDEDEEEDEEDNEDEEEDGNDHTGTTHKTGFHSATPHNPSHHPAAPIYQPYSASAAGPSSSYYPSAYASRTPGSVPGPPYLYPQRPHYQPFHTP